ncbi:MAG TPA: hypothetical protein VJT71_16630 [Pyrinomonadaceae bacterium]|nr:hypothetical protein [Pyrinomonadaceae bacterium]
MKEDPYVSALEFAQQELEELTAMRAEMDGRIARLRETVISLAYLVSKEDQSEMPDVAGLGLTEAVAKVLRLSGMALTPAQIRDELARRGFNVKKYVDIIPNITKVLQRLATKGHVDPSVDGTSTRKVYIWSPMQPEIFNWTDDVTEIEVPEFTLGLPGEMTEKPTSPKQKRLAQETERRVQRGPTRRQKRKAAEAEKMFKKD